MALLCMQNHWLILSSVFHSHRYDMFTTASLRDMEHQPSIEDEDLGLGLDELGASVS
jgi:hypothetical protein